MTIEQRLYECAERLGVETHLTASDFGQPLPIWPAQQRPLKDIAHDVLAKLPVAFGAWVNFSGEDGRWTGTYKQNYPDGSSWVVDVVSGTFEECVTALAERCVATV